MTGTAVVFVGISKDAPNDQIQETTALEYARKQELEVAYIYEALDGPIGSADPGLKELELHAFWGLFNVVIVAQPGLLISDLEQECNLVSRFEQYGVQVVYTMPKLEVVIDG